MKLKIALFIVGFLEKNVCADARLLELTVILNRCGGNIDVYTADIAVLVMNRIDGFYTFEDILNGIVYRILARFDRKTLVSHILQGDYFTLNLFLSELFPCNMLVLHMIRTVNTAVHTVI